MEMFNMLFRLFILTLIPVLIIPAAAFANANGNVIPLAGQWRFQLDPDNQGIDQQWYKSTLNDTVTLPGTTDENEKGTRNDERTTEHLSRPYIYTGPAWYQRDVHIPDTWAGKHITLILERSKRTRVWVDHNYIGTDSSFSTSQIYDLSNALTPGQHVLTIQVNNADHPPMGHSHAITEHTQTNWNGIVGKFQLQAADPVWIEDLEIYPNTDNKKAKLCLTIGNITNQPVEGIINVNAESFNTKSKHTLKPQKFEFSSKEKMTMLEVDYLLGQHVLLWDEFSPALYKLTATLTATVDNHSYQDGKSINFGIRDFAAKGTQFKVNGKTAFLRGKVDNCVFPLTGYSSMDKAAWLRIFKIAKSYGLNHYRFHSWCPPEAAFDAADEVGIYLQPELPTWSAFGHPAHDKFMEPEGYRILDTYGNHPSFVMFSLGNELRGDRNLMARLVTGFRKKDPRRLYVQGSNYFFNSPKLAQGDDYWVTIMTGGRWDGTSDQTRYGTFVRGSFDQHTRGHINNKPPSTTTDYYTAIAHVPVPVVSHEIASYEVYPDYKEIEKYTGVLKPRNLEVFRERLAKKHMLDQADDFFKASEALSVICHREEVEAALRTPGFGGFQMLDLQDFPGQGTALVGILDAFMDSKGLITPQKWREFCSPTVPLALMEKYTWTTFETFVAEIKIAHFGPEDLNDATITWFIKDHQGKAIQSGQLPSMDIPQGTLTQAGKIIAPLTKVQPPAKLVLEVRLKGTEFVNHYDLWVYPSRVNTIPAEGITIRQAFDEDTRQLLDEGKKVLLLPELHTCKNSIGGAFQSNFWCFTYFKKYNPPGSNGILCNPTHPALAAFPTEFHSNWQWWHIVKDARPIILDDTPPNYRPIVQVIDNFVRNQKMGLLFEAKVTNGKLLVCPSNLLRHQDKPEVRQLLYSLLQYMNSEQFQPATELNPRLIQNWFE